MHRLASNHSPPARTLLLLALFLFLLLNPACLAMKKGDNAFTLSKSTTNQQKGFIRSRSTTTNQGTRVQVLPLDEGDDFTHVDQQSKTESSKESKEEKKKPKKEKTKEKTKEDKSTLKVVQNPVFKPQSPNSQDQNEVQPKKGIFLRSQSTVTGKVKPQTPKKVEETKKEGGIFSRIFSSNKKQTEVIGPNRNRNELRRKKKEKGEDNPPLVFGAPLPEDGVPPVVELLIHQLNEKSRIQRMPQGDTEGLKIGDVAFTEEGIYRLSGTHSNIQNTVKQIEENARNEVDLGTDINWDDLSIIEVAALLKLYIRELTSKHKIFETDAEGALLSLVNKENKLTVEDVRRFVIKFVHPPQRRLLRILATHFNFFIKFRPFTKMGLDNINLVIGPNILPYTATEYGDPMIAKYGTATRIVFQAMAVTCGTIFDPDGSQLLVWNEESEQCVESDGKIPLDAIKWEDAVQVGKYGVHNEIAEKENVNGKSNEDSEDSEDDKFIGPNTIHQTSLKKKTDGSQGLVQSQKMSTNEGLSISVRRKDFEKLQNRPLISPPIPPSNYTPNLPSDTLNPSVKPVERRNTVAGNISLGPNKTPPKLTSKPSLIIPNFSSSITPTNDPTPQFRRNNSNVSNVSKGPNIINKTPSPPKGNNDDSNLNK